MNKDKIPLNIRESWGPGEWQDEPDFLMIEYKGWQGAIRRTPWGTLNGYVYIPENSVFYSYDGRFNDIDGLLDVHGGITYDEFALYKENGGKVRVIGFDCAHCYDVTPAVQYDPNPEFKKLCDKIEEMTSGNIPKTYKNIEFVTNEIHMIIEQIILLSKLPIFKK